MQELNYRIFDARIREKALKKFFPLRILFELTYRCNLSCRHCYVTAEDRKELSTKQVFYILDELSRVGTFYIGFTGGEIFSRKDIFDILSYAKRKGFQIAILSNGTLITPKVATFLKELKPDKIDISLYSLHKEVFEYVTGVKDSFDRCIKAIHLLRQQGIPLCIKTTVMKMNYREVSRIRKFAKSLKAIFRFSPFLSPKTNGSREPLKYSAGKEIILGFESEEKDIVSKSCDDSKPLKLLRWPKKDLLFCAAGCSEASINPYGDMQLCLDFIKPRFSVLDNSGVLGAWSKLVDFRKSLNRIKDYACRDCNLRSYCEICPGKSLLETGKLDSCVKFYEQCAQSKRKLWVNNERD